MPVQPIQAPTTDHATSVNNVCLFWTRSKQLLASSPAFGLSTLSNRVFTVVCEVAARMGALLSQEFTCSHIIQCAPDRTLILWHAIVLAARIGPGTKSTLAGG